MQKFLSLSVAKKPSPAFRNNLICCRGERVGVRERIRTESELSPHPHPLPLRPSLH